jgi:hypothetical protein
LERFFGAASRPFERNQPAYDQLPWFLALVIAEATDEKIRLMLSETPGMIAPAATATKPTINAYSIKS